MKRRLRAPSPALVISLIALFVALGGTSYAAIASVPRNSIGSKQLKKNAVTGVKIKNGAVTKSKINTTGLTVPNAVHATSASSATSATNAASATVADAPGTLPSGHTEYGTIGSQPPKSGTAADIEIGDNAQLPFPAPVALDAAHVVLVGSITDGSPSQCSGSAAAPTAAAGYICIYPFAQHNAQLNQGTVWSSNTSKYGFQMSWSSVTSGLCWVFANWAYTAP